MDNYAFIPADLKSKERWVCFEMIKKDGQDKLTKIPKNPHCLSNAKSNDPKTWGSFDLALEAIKKYKYDGLAIILGGGVC
jgi:putative DNA primase/helicase